MKYYDKSIICYRSREKLRKVKYKLFNKGKIKKKHICGVERALPPRQPEVIRKLVPRKQKQE